MLSRLLRLRMVEFLISSSHQLHVPPIVKYTALSMFAERFYPSLKRLHFFSIGDSFTSLIELRRARFIQENDTGNWLLQPLRESNLQLFTLISIWISSKLHDSCPLSVNSLKSLGDVVITEQHFTTRDFLEAVLDFEIGALNISFVFLEDLLIQLRGLARIGQLVNFDACMDIMDLLYETEETSTLFSSPCSLAASVLVASYVITVPMQQWEFPLLPWVKFVTSYKEEDIQEIVRTILEHVLKDSSEKKGSNHLIFNGG